MNNYQIKVLGIITKTLITALGMQAENKQRESLGYSMAYDDDAFCSLNKEIDEALKMLK